MFVFQTTASILALTFFLLRKTTDVLQHELKNF
jgi:hypothetical protein